MMKSNLLLTTMVFASLNMVSPACSMEDAFLEIKKEGNQISSLVSSSTRDSFGQEEQEIIQKFIARNKAKSEEEVNAESRLKALNGKNSSSYPLTQKTVDRVQEIVGMDNKKPFVLSYGMHILFEDESETYLKDFDRVDLEFAK